MKKNEFKVLLVYPNLPFMLVPPLSIALFTQILKKQGYLVCLFDTTSYTSEEGSSPENRVKFLQARKFSNEDDLGISAKKDLIGDFRKKVIELQPNALVFSVVEDAFLKTVKMMDCIKDLNIPSILGGIFPTNAPEYCLNSPNINLIGLGEGEKTIVDFVEAIRLNLPLNNIQGTWYKDKNNHIHRNNLNQLVDINLTIPNFDLFEKVRFYRPMGGKIFKSFPIETYRGCPYHCTYCNSPGQAIFAKKNNQGYFLRRKSIPKLQEELKQIIHHYSPEFFYFIDDSFLARPKKEIIEFCDMYEEFKLPFWFNTRPENCNYEILKRLKEVNCYRISFGIECGNEDYRKKTLRRNISNQSIIDSFSIIEKSGIAFSINLIIGFPGETRDLIMETVNLVREIHGYDTITVSMFTPYHGTELRKVAEKNGWLGKDSITIHTTSQSMLNMPKPYVNRDELDGLMRVLLLYCYFPKSEWREIKKAEINSKEGNNILQYYSDLYKKNFLKDNQDDTKNIVPEISVEPERNEK